MNNEERLRYGILENKEDDVFYNLGEFETFEEAVKARESRAVFRDKNKLIIIQRVEVKNE